MSNWSTPQQILESHPEILGQRANLRANTNKERRELWCAARFSVLLGLKETKLKACENQADSADVELQTQSVLHKIQVVEATTKEFQQWLYGQSDTETVYGIHPERFIKPITDAVSGKENKKYADVNEMNLLVYFNNSMLGAMDEERQATLATLQERFKTSRFRSIALIWDTDDGLTVDFIKGNFPS